MTLDEFAIATDILAQAKRIADDLDISPAVFMDFGLETHVAEDRGQGDGAGLEAGIRAMIDGNAAHLARR